MTRLLPLKGLIKNIKGDIPQRHVRLYLPKDRAYQLLKELTGQDFGEDINAWKNWIIAHPNVINQNCHIDN
jgi:hypothetical protein